MPVLSTGDWSCKIVGEDIECVSKYANYVTLKKGAEATVLYLDCRKKDSLTICTKGRE